MKQTYKILVISYSYAPSAQVGGKRFTFLTELLARHYPDIQVLTVGTRHIPLIDNSLPQSGKIHRVGMFPPYPLKKGGFLKKIFKQLWEAYFCLFDPYSGWILPAYLKGLRIVVKEKIDLVIATGPPFAAVAVGLFLNSTTGVKLVVDHRDPWPTENMSFGYGKLTGNRINAFLERWAAKRAAALVFCSRRMRSNFLGRMAVHTKASCFVVENGFRRLPDIQPLRLEDDKIVMAYAGNFYGTRNITLISGPLRDIMNEGLISRDNFAFHIFGELKEPDQKAIREHGLQDIVISHNRVPYEDIIRYLKGADILFLPSGSDVQYAIPFKFFDYLSVQRPVLTVTPPESAMADMMAEIDCGYCAASNCPQSIRSCLRSLIRGPNNFSYAGAQNYYWKNISGKFIKVIANL